MCLFKYSDIKFEEWNGERQKENYIRVWREREEKGDGLVRRGITKVFQLTDKLTNQKESGNKRSKVGVKGFKKIILTLYKRF